MQFIHTTRTHKYNKWHLQFGLLHFAHRHHRKRRFARMRIGYRSDSMWLLVLMRSVLHENIHNLYEFMLAIAHMFIQPQSQHTQTEKQKNPEIAYISNVYTFNSHFRHSIRGDILPQLHCRWYDRYFRLMRRLLVPVFGKNHISDVTSHISELIHFAICTRNR